jgi:trk system potassium uptake protein TrkA
MNIIIVGCGKVGFTLAEQLSNEGHEITLIDNDSGVLEKSVSTLDIMGVHGNGVSYRVQMEAGIKDADLLLAVTDQDEVNLLSCLIARRAGHCQTIARVRNPEYFEEISYIKEELKLAMAINPERSAAYDILRLIQIPSAMDVDSIAKGRGNLVSFKIPQYSPLDGHKIMELRSIIGENVLVCVMQRGDSTVIPSGATVLHGGDTISVLLPITDMPDFFQKLKLGNKPIKNVIIAGGGGITFYLAKHLIKSRVKVKIIEADRKKCDMLSEELPGAIIVNGDATDTKLLDEEGIRQTEAFVALTNMDEENIMLSMYVNSISDAKTITKINHLAFEDIIHQLPLGSIICPKNITAEKIIKHVRSMQNSVDSSEVESLYRLMDGRVEALEFMVRDVKENEPLIGKRLMDLRIRKDFLIGSIFRDGSMIIPSGRDTIEAGDTVVVVTTVKKLSRICEILQ